MKLLDEMAANQNLVLELERGSYKTGLLTLNKEVLSKHKSVCYITLTKPADAVISDLEKEGININRYYFIDCVSKKAGLKTTTAKTTFVSNPTSLTELAIAVTKAIKQKKIDLLFFDSISSLLVYNSELSVVKFLHFLMIAIKGTEAKAVYLIMKSDLKRMVVKEIELFADTITWLE